MIYIWYDKCNTTCDTTGYHLIYSNCHFNIELDVVIPGQYWIFFHTKCNNIHFIEKYIQTLQKQQKHFLYMPLYNYMSTFLTLYLLWQAQHNVSYFLIAFQWSYLYSIWLNSDLVLTHLYWYMTAWERPRKSITRVTWEWPYVMNI